jgi:protein SCO1/2
MTRLYLLLLAGLLAVPGPAAADEHAMDHGNRMERGHHESPALAPAPLPGLSIYQLDSSWTDQTGHTGELRELRGRPLVAAMVYTSCEYVCPLIVEEVKKVERRLPSAERDRVRFVLISFDPERDSPRALAVYARKRELPATRWTLLTGSPDAVLELTAALGVRFRKEANGEFSHSNIVHVIDAEGVVVHQQVGLQQALEPTVAAVTSALR